MFEKSSISVTVRVRPFSIREAAQVTRIEDSPSFFGDGSLIAAPPPKLTGKGIRSVVKVIDDRVLVFDPPEGNPVARYQKTIVPQGKRVKDMRFGFDKVFDENATQEDVYEATTKSLLDSVLDGYNATVFAYGATGCGKTHTISGTPQRPGIIFLTCAELFERIGLLADEKEIELTLSYLEIYNETIRDLLVPGGSKMGLQLREDSSQNISVAGLSTHQPKNVQQVMNMILMGNQNRTMSPTEANATSSRSHAVLQINVLQKPKTAGLSENHLMATLSIIDLAGSERASVTKNRGDRLLEGANINRSLLALGNCINALCDPHKSNHIPYRDSKLTRLLKFSLGGNCKTVMIVCVSPSSQHYEETHNTLKYADRAKNIKTKISRNTMNVNRHVSQYVKAIYDLRNEVEELRKRLGDSTKEAMEKIVRQGSAKENSIKDGMKRLRAAFEQSGEMRRERVNDLKSLRMVEGRTSVVTAWIAAFDQAFDSYQTENPPACVLKMRAEAQKVVLDLRGNHQYLQHKLAGPNWEKVIDSALQTGLRSLQACGGVTETDIATLTCEANLLRMTAERDILHAIAEADADLSSMVHALSKAHFETVGTITRILESNVTEEEALEMAKKSLFEVQQGASDAVSHVIKPNGELVSGESCDAYKPASPRKKKFPRVSLSMASPAKPSQLPQLGVIHSASPVRYSPRPIKVKTPKKAVKFGKKKRVRWQDETEDSSFTLEEPRRKRLEEPSILYEDSSSILVAPLENELSFSATSFSTEEAPGIMQPPIRPRNNRLAVGFLSKNRESLAVVPPAEIPLPSDSPLRSFDTDQAINKIRTDADVLSDLSSSDEAKPWRSHVRPSKSAMRKSAASSTISRPAGKRRSPSSSSQLSPDNGLFKIGHARRMPRGDKENGSMTTVLSPKSNGIKTGARRMTINGPSGGSLRISTKNTMLLGQIREGNERESMAFPGKQNWR
ncbi:P-loop containing nucleoside triphosphate hydrolase protein [Tuber brumale]|nr:P-loop containing nucleoside triphosphate hydrolase protein [Tuber brumale]